MSLAIGIVGLPNVGKSTLFKALTKQQIEVANYPFATIDPNVGVVAVPDERLDQLAQLNQSEKIIPTTIEFVDIAGLVKGASQGEGLGNQFLANIREVDAIAHVVRCFEDDNITHVEERVNPLEDIDIIETELLLADLETVSKMHSRAEKMAKSQKPDEIHRESGLKKIKTALEQGQPARSVTLTEKEHEVLHDLQLITVKPILYVGNISEDNLVTSQDELQAQWKLPAPAIYISMKLEAELSEMSAEEAQAMLKEFGQEHSGLDKLITAGYSLLDLITYITTGPKETRAWTIKQGTKAPQAAGAIHSDFERGFIAADTIQWSTLLESGSWSKAREFGHIRSEGKEYVVQDGDVMEFKYNV